MSRIAVVFPPIRVSRDFIDYPYFADVGALQAAAVLREAGHHVDLVDALAMPGATLAPEVDTYVCLGAPLDDVIARIAANTDAVLVAYTPFHRPPSRDPLLAELLVRIRKVLPDQPIVLADLYQSGQHVVDAPSSEILAAFPEVSALVRYEAEGELAALFERLLREGATVSAFVVHGLDPKHLDELPLPAWDLVDMPAYFAFHESVVRGLGRPAWAFPIDGASAPVLTSRGCPYRCVHCSSNPTSRTGGDLDKPKTRYSFDISFIDENHVWFKTRLGEYRQPTSTVGPGHPPP